MRQQIKPNGDRVLVLALAPVSQTQSGIEIPASAQESQQRGIVVAQGDLVTFCQIGDEVLFAKYSGTQMNDLGEGEEEYLMMKQEDLFAKVIQDQNDQLRKGA